MQSYFRRHLRNAVKRGTTYREEAEDFNWSVCYIDAFAWRGEYDGNVVPVEFIPGDQENLNKGSAILALLEGLQAMKEIYEQSQDQSAFLLRPIKAIHFIFNDLNKKNIENLKELVPPECLKFGFQVVRGNNFLMYKLFDDSESAIGWKFQVSFVVGSFEDLAVQTDADNIFSFIDPCGIKQIPLLAVGRFIGDNKEAFINLMVMTILRVGNNHIAQSCIYKLFGQSDAATKVLATAQKRQPELNEKDQEKQLKEKFETFVTEYENTLEDLCKGSHATAARFLFANGKRSREKGDRYYMVFLSSTVSRLKAIQDMKYVMQKFTQENGENRFTDYYSWNGIEVPLGRKTTNKDEAIQIWRKLQGQTLTLYDLQEWVLLKTPFPFHARALRVLEKQGCLVVDTSQGDERIKKSFRASSSEFCKRATKLWKLTFGVYDPSFC